MAFCGSALRLLHYIYIYIYVYIYGVCVAVIVVNFVGLLFLQCCMIIVRKNTS